MLTYTRILFAVWAPITGFVIRARYTAAGASSVSDGWEAIWPFTGDTGAWLAFFYGIGVGLFVIPFLVRWLEQSREFERFFEQLGSADMGRARTRFFKNLSRAYELWRAEAGHDPKNINWAIRESEFPSWLPVFKGRMIDVAKEEFEKNHSVLWEFIQVFQREVDDWIRFGKEPTLLSTEGIEEFHDARQTLVYFWNNVAIRTFKWKTLRYRNIKRYAEAEADLLKALTYLSIEISICIERDDRGQEILFLGAILFEKTKWGLREWLWNPLLSTSENIRS